MSKIDAVLERANELRLAMEKELRKSMEELFKEFWEKNPVITAVVWTQYAPYFNDGDPCIFRVHDLAFTNATPEMLEEFSREIAWANWEDEEDSSYFALGSWDLEEGVKVLSGDYDVQSMKDLNQLLCSSPMSSVMEETFGSDHMVFATREGFKVDYYENHA